MRDALERRVNIKELGNLTRENLSADYAPAATQAAQSPLTPEPTPASPLVMPTLRFTGLGSHWSSLVFFKICQLSFTAVYLLTVFSMFEMFLSPHLFPPVF